LVFARRGGASVETSLPSDQASAIPARAADVNRSRYVPLRAWTAGARSVSEPFIARSSASVVSGSSAAIGLSQVGQCCVPSFANMSLK
jgi:hypothetical protein